MRLEHHLYERKNDCDLALGNRRDHWVVEEHVDVLDREDVPFATVIFAFVEKVLKARLLTVEDVNVLNGFNLYSTLISRQLSAPISHHNRSRTTVLTIEIRV